MGTLIQMPYSHVTHFLETLSHNGVPDHLVLRYRMDKQFAEKATEALITEYVKNPGERFVIEIDRSYSRGKLNALIGNSGASALNFSLIASLEPHKNHVSKTGVEELETFLVPLYKETNEEEATAILDEMGLESVCTEEALTCAIYQEWWSLIRNGGYSVVVLGAKMQSKVKINIYKTEFLSFGITAVYRMVSLFDFPSFSSSNRFLVKRKKPQPKKEEE